MDVSLTVSEGMPHANALEQISIQIQPWLLWIHFSSLHICTKHLLWLWELLSSLVMKDFFFSFLHSVGKYIRQYYAIATACCNSKCNVLFFFQDDSYQSTRWGRSHMVAWALLRANLFKPKQVISSKMSRRVWRGQSASLKGTVCNISSV